VKQILISFRFRFWWGKLSLFIAIWLLAGAGLSAAQDPKIEISPRKITVGDPVGLIISMPVGSGEVVHFPVHESFAPAEVIRIDTLDQTSTVKSLRYTISLFETGEVELPDLPVVIDRSGVNDTLWLDPGQIEVTSVMDEADTSSIRDIRPPVKLRWTLKEAWPYIIGGLVALALAVVAFLWWRKRRREQGDIPEYVPPPIPPDVVAMRRLEELRVKKLWQDGHPKEYHSELTDILKEYIGNSYNFNALEMTTEELLAERSKWTFDDDLFAQLRRILTIADFVKFAKFNAQPHDHEKSLELAFLFVEKTRPSRTPLVPESA